MKLLNLLSNLGHLLGGPTLVKAKSFLIKTTKFYPSFTKVGPRVRATERGGSGFTLIEILVISPILIIVTIGITTLLFNQYGRLVQQDSRLNLQLEAQNILFSLQDDMWYANQFASTKNSNLVDSYAPGGGWNYNTTPPTLIVSQPALTTNRRDSNRQVVYINQSTCTPPDGNGANSVLYNNAIYFISGSNFYKRILTAPAGMATCGTPYQKQTCPPPNSSQSCPADKLLSDHLNTLTVTYYDANNATVTIPENAESAKVDIGLKDKAFAEDIYANSSLRVKKLNR